MANVGLYDRKKSTLSGAFYLAVGQGFEPREPLGSTVFKTAAFDHSASPPNCFKEPCSLEDRDYTQITK
jgi:hypothetical protein